MNVYAILTAAALARPKAPCLITQDASLSYGDVERIAGQISAWLCSRGLKPGDRVLVAAPKCVQ